MSTLAFTGEMARLQRANAQSHDNVVRQGKVLAALSLRTGERVLEIGCGGGYYTFRPDHTMRSTDQDRMSIGTPHTRLVRWGLLRRSSPF